MENPGIFRQPIYVLRRIAYKFYEITHPDEPWISQGAVLFCEKSLNKDQVGLEWGSGRSTAWFGSRLKSLLSIEFDSGWHSKVVSDLQNKGLENVECRYIPIEHSITEPTKLYYEKMPAYVNIADNFADNSLDFVVVDGHYRQACILAALKKIKPGGLLLVDNTNWLALEEWGVPDNWSLVHQSSNVMTQTSIWQKP